MSEFQWRRDEQCAVQIPTPQFDLQPKSGQNPQISNIFNHFGSFPASGRCCRLVGLCAESRTP
jgi:hypothetical protein